MWKTWNWNIFHLQNFHFTCELGGFSQMEYLIHMLKELIQNFTSEILVYKTFISHTKWRIRIWKLISHMKLSFDIRIWNNLHVKYFHSWNCMWTHSPSTQVLFTSCFPRKQTSRATSYLRGKKCKYNCKVWMTKCFDLFTGTSPYTKIYRGTRPTSAGTISPAGRLGREKSLERGWQGLKLSNNTCAFPN